MLLSGKGVNMFHKLKNVKVLKDFELLLEFQEGCSKIYDVKPLLDTIPVFNVFQDKPYLFEDAEVDKGGYGIVWNDDVDLSCNELWDNGRAI